VSRGTRTEPKCPWTIAWEGWRGNDDTVIRGFTLLTTAACAALRGLHERMPVVLEETLWLGETEEDAAALPRPSGTGFRTRRVSTYTEG